jgi:hypothetical protein
LLGYNHLKAPLGLKFASIHTPVVVGRLLFLTIGFSIELLLRRQFSSSRVRDPKERKENELLQSVRVSQG